MTTARPEAAASAKALAEAAALLVLQKNPGHLRGRKRQMIAKEDRQSAIVFVDEGVSKEARHHKACEILEIDARTAGEKRIEAPIHY